MLTFVYTYEYAYTQIYKFVSLHHYCTQIYKGGTCMHTNSQISIITSFTFVYTYEHAYQFTN